MESACDEVDLNGKPSPKTSVAGLSFQEYSDCFKALQLQSSDTEPITEYIAKLIDDVGVKVKDRGLRILDVGPGEGLSLEDVLNKTSAKIECVDCVEPNTVLAEELSKRLDQLQYKSKIWHCFFDENAGSYLQAYFYDIVMFSRVLYYFEDPAKLLSFAINEFTSKEHGMAIAKFDGAMAAKNLDEKLLPILSEEGGIELKHQHFDKSTIQGGKFKICSEKVHSGGCLLNPLFTPRRSLEETTSNGRYHDKNKRQVATDLLQFFTLRNAENLSKKCIDKVLDVIRENVICEHGFFILPSKTITLCLTRE